MGGRGRGGGGGGGGGRGRRPPANHRRPLPPRYNFVNSEGLAYEAAEANRCLREGLTESPLFDSEECLDVMKVISDIRANWEEKK